MSHTVEAASKVTSLEIAELAARRLNWDRPFIGQSVLYDGTVTRGIQFRPPRWLFPVCADMQNGRLQWDNYVPGRYDNSPEWRSGPTAVRWPSDIPTGSASRYAGNYEEKGYDEISPFLDAYNAEATIAAAQSEGWIVEEFHNAETGAIELTLSR